jgi:hypothetical protein
MRSVARGILARLVVFTGTRPVVSKLGGEITHEGFQVFASFLF